jgi:hypothetical protein
MPTYTTSSLVLAHLPSNLPEAVTNNTTTDIAAASALVESGVGPRFAFSYESSTQKFPEIDSDPATPAIIEQAARYYAVSLQYLRLEVAEGIRSEEDEDLNSVLFEKKAEKILEDIESGKKTVEISGSNIKGTALKSYEDETYEDDEDPKARFDHEELDTLCP